MEIIIRSWNLELFFGFCSFFTQIYLHCCTCGGFLFLFILLLSLVSCQEASWISERSSALQKTSCWRSYRCSPTEALACSKCGRGDQRNTLLKVFKMKPTRCWMWVSCFECSSCLNDCMLILSRTVLTDPLKGFLAGFLVLSVKMPELFFID